jgi:hypothetical protein
MRLVSLDLTPTVLAFELPVIGSLTRLEAIRFVTYHTQRHNHQLKNIRQQLTVQPTTVDSLYLLPDLKK